MRSLSWCHSIVGRSEPFSSSVDRGTSRLAYAVSAKGKEGGVNWSSSFSHSPFVLVTNDAADSGLGSKGWEFDDVLRAIVGKSNMTWPIVSINTRTFFELSDFFTPTKQRIFFKRMAVVVSLFSVTSFL